MTKTVRRTLDAKGRCRAQAIHYKGGSWCSPLGSPMVLGNREYGPDGRQRRELGLGCRRNSGGLHRPPALHWSNVRRLRIGSRWVRQY